MLQKTQNIDFDNILVSVSEVKAMAPTTPRRRGENERTWCKRTVPDWVNELRAGKDLKRGLRVYLKAAARRRLRRDPSGGTVVNVWDDHGTPYIKLRLDGENSRQAISYHPSWLRPGVQYRVTFRMAG